MRAAHRRHCFLRLLRQVSMVQAGLQRHHLTLQRDSRQLSSLQGREIC